MTLDARPTDAELLALKAARERQAGKRSTATNRIAQAPMIFRFPMPPNLTNPRKRSHWGAVHGAKQKYYSVCDLMLKAGLLPAPPDAPIQLAELSSVMYLGHAMDDDNALARHKWAVDWLKTRGYIAEDSKKHIRWAGFPQQIVKRKQDYTLAITLRALTPSEKVA